MQELRKRGLRTFSISGARLNCGETEQVTEIPVLVAGQSELARARMNIGDQAPRPVEVRCNLDRRPRLVECLRITARIHERPGVVPVRSGIQWIQFQTAPRFRKQIIGTPDGSEVVCVPL